MRVYKIPKILVLVLKKKKIPVLDSNWMSCVVTIISSIMNINIIVGHTMLLFCLIGEQKFAIIFNIFLDIEYIFIKIYIFV